MDKKEDTKELKQMGYCFVVSVFMALAWWAGGEGIVIFVSLFFVLFGMIKIIEELRKLNK